MRLFSTVILMTFKWAMFRFLSYFNNFHSKIKILYFVVSVTIMQDINAATKENNKSLIMQACLRFKVLSYNIHHGQGTDSKIDLNRIARQIKVFSPHFVALQEVDDKTRRSFEQNQASLLSQLSGMKFDYFSPSIKYDHGLYGNAILSNFKADELTAISLPFKKEPRTAQIAKFNIKGFAINIINTHLDLDPSAHKESIVKIEKTISLLDGAVLLVGDLNIPQNSVTIQELRAHYLVNKKSSALFTFPSNSPRRQIDYILPRLNSDFSWSTKVIIGSDAEASDHRAILSLVKICKN